MKIQLGLVAVCLLVVTGYGVRAQAPAAGDDYVKTHYAKYEYRIPMRDGAKMFAAVYVPKMGAFKDAGPYPFLMTKTPYSCAPYGVDNFPARIGPNKDLMESGYIFVCEDARGRNASEGVFQEMNPHIDEKKSPKDVDESSDMYDTVEFLLKNVPNNNGKVGIAGISYPGFYTSASVIDSHPAIKAASPQAPMTDLFFNDDGYHGGAFMLGANYGFYRGFVPQKNPVIPGPRVPREPSSTENPDTYATLLAAGVTENLDKGKDYLDGENWLFHDQVTHTTYDDYWNKRDISRHMKNVHAAMMEVGGWFDAEDISGPVKTFHAIDKYNPGAVNSLVIGPWTHGGWERGDGDRLGDATFNAKTSEFFQEKIEYPFFEYYLKGVHGGPLPKAYVFETGTNVWKTYDAWPPKTGVAKTLYFHAGGGLSFEAPKEQTGKDEYVSDPAHPVPFVGYPTGTVPQRYMADDQRFASERPDVLVYESEPLTEDVTIAGPVRPKLKVASTGTDSDFVVKLIDVYPYNAVGDETGNKRIIGAAPIVMGGYQQLVRGEPMRAKFRDSWEKPTPLPPGKMVEVNSDMPDVNHTFRVGHRIMVQVQSSWFPLVDRNPQTFTDIPTAKPEQFVKATETVYRNSGAASGVEVLVLPQP
ncbi:MAG: CocE/NonD family hydrolase [Edaphobacter sp.]